MKFLVESSFKQVPTPEMLALIPAESAWGNVGSARRAFSARFGCRPIAGLADSRRRMQQCA